MRTPGKLVLAVAVAVVLAACAGPTGEGKGGRETPAMKTVTYDVEGMTCSGCENAIKSAVRKMDGVVSAEASHGDKRAIVGYEEGRVRPEQIQAAIERLGYKARPRT